jgi:16S rRNA processing protein RimM
MTDTDWITIGRIVSPQGLKGELRVYPDTDFPERFLEPGERWLQEPKGTPPRSVHLLKGRYLEGKGLYVVQLEGVTDRDQAESLRNCTLLVPAEDRPELEEGEFYVADLMGLRVLLHDSGEEIGTVTDIYEAGNDLLEVSLTTAADSDDAPRKPQTVMVPFVEEIVPVIDLEEGYIEINPPVGLMEL